MVKTIILSLCLLLQNDEVTILKKSTYKQVTLSTEKPHKSVETIYYFVVQKDSTIKEIFVDKKIFNKFKVGQKIKL